MTVTTLCLTRLLVFSPDVMYYSIVQLRSPIAGQQAYFCFAVLNRAPANIPVRGSGGPGAAVSQGGMSRYGAAELKGMSVISLPQWC